MPDHDTVHPSPPIDEDQIIEPLAYDFGLTRRSVVQALGAGLLIAVTAGPAIAQQPSPPQRRGGGGLRRQPEPIELGARLHIGQDGTITLMTGKVEGGQGSRAQITQAAAEELRVPVERVRLLMADTSLCPDDGMTVGSRTTPSTLPPVRQACAAARQLLDNLAAQRPGAEVTYADLAAADHSAEALQRAVPADVKVTAVDQWTVLGQSVPRPNGRDLVTGSHAFPSDMTRPGMLYGKILRPPSYGATLASIELGPAKALEGVIVVRDGNFVGVAAPTTHLATRAIQALEASAKWQAAAHPDSATLFDHLRRNARGETANPHADELGSAAKVLRARYDVSYIQHAPLEPRAAVAQWVDGTLTVWTATQNPFGVRRELAGAFHIPEQRVRVIVPDFGGAFGGKHTGEAAVEAARLAQVAHQPVAVRWTRAEEFTWASFRPAAAIDAEAGLDDDGRLWSWHFVNINSGRSAVQSPYRVPRMNCHYVESAAPLRHGSYRALAATANNFARECFMDELADAAGRDPLDFRLAHLDDPRLRAVLEEAARRFGWSQRRGKREDHTGAGLACGTEKGSYVAACAEVAVDRRAGTIHVRRIVQAFECGAITSPGNLRAQVEGCMIMGLGPALREAMDFADGKITNASFWKYPVPRLEDVPQLEIHLLDRPDLPSAGAGETPLIAVAPAIANAVFHATGLRLRTMPLRIEGGRAGRP